MSKQLTFHSALCTAGRGRPVVDRGGVVAVQLGRLLICDRVPTNPERWMPSWKCWLRLQGSLRPRPGLLGAAACSREGEGLR